MKILFALIIFTLLSSCSIPQKQTTQNSPFLSNTLAPVVSIAPSPTAKESGTVPLPSGEDIIRTFFNLIGEKRIPEAISMMDKSLVKDDSIKQTWGANFNSLDSVTVKSISKASEEEWTATRQIYKVVLNLKVNPRGANAPIPYYGWNNGDNTRWVIIQKDTSNLWKIVEIATGP